ncbi:MAG: tRNA glutamyl-Q(34) synthetase GluQRS [Propionibacteriaceae bacterium]|jgi:glutamyl-tRNA synthetase|nr:tRNA glutamyl-Q(34) synthetase GluQRS [Propionibacteriaceae bacterium]
MSGRFAPTPSADLHLGNLRTALVAWLAARASARGFIVRVEDLDWPRLPDADAIVRRQLADLTRLGLTWDGEVVRQRDRTDLYEAALARLAPLVYECFCSRKEVATATRAPHGTTPRYPGTCRNLTAAARDRLRRVRPPALRVDAGAAELMVHDELWGRYAGLVDDFVVRRADGVFAYNFAVVVDDGLQGIDQVVRGDDLLESAPRQAWLATQLGFPVPSYLHIPLVLAADGTRLAKRDRAQSLTGLLDAGLTLPGLLSRLAHSLGLAAADEPVDLMTLVRRFNPARLPREPWLV